jgi:hypothetical protein
MDRSLEARHWRRGFAAGVAALALSVGGQMATSGALREGSACPIAAQQGLAGQLFDEFVPRVRIPTVAHRVALALLRAMLHDSCS